MFLFRPNLLKSPPISLRGMAWRCGGNTNDELVSNLQVHSQYKNIFFFT
jgi:hypothetical protein